MKKTLFLILIMSFSIIVLVGCNQTTKETTADEQTTITTNGTDATTIPETTITTNGTDATTIPETTTVTTDANKALYTPVVQDVVEGEISWSIAGSGSVSFAVSINGVSYEVASNSDSTSNGSFYLTYDIEKVGEYDVKIIATHNGISYESDAYKIEVSSLASPVIQVDDSANGVTFSWTPTDESKVAVPYYYLEIVGDSVYTVSGSSYEYSVTSGDVSATIIAAGSNNGHNWYIESEKSNLISISKTAHPSASLTINGTTVSWDPITVEGETVTYTVTINDVEKAVKITDTTYDFSSTITEKGTYNLQVAVNYSKYSVISNKIFEAKGLDIPSVSLKYFTVSKGLSLSVNEVDNAIDYAISIDNGATWKTSTYVSGYYRYFDISSSTEGFEQLNKVEVKIKAIGSGIYFDSDASETSTYYKLVSPENTKIIGTVLSWDKCEASRYYNIKMNPASGSTLSTIWFKYVSGNSVDLATLVPEGASSEFEIVVFAFDNNGNSEYTTVGGIGTTYSITGTKK